MEERRCGGRALRRMECRRTLRVGALKDKVAGLRGVGGGRAEKVAPRREGLGRQPRG